MNRITTKHSLWQATDLAIRKVMENRDATWVGVDDAGEVVVGEGEPAGVPVVIASGDALTEVLDDVWKTAVVWGEEGTPLSIRRSVEAIRAFGAVAQLFEERRGGIGTDPELYEPGVTLWAWAIGDETTVRIGFAAPSPLDRVLAHIARGCTHCRRPVYVRPEAPEEWDAVAAWQRRWESTELSVADAALWTDVAGCRPEVAIELRADGFTPQELQRAGVVWMHEGNGDLADIADALLEWTRSGFSWTEIDKWGGLMGGNELLPLARELRARGRNHDTVWKDIVVDGRTVALGEFVMEEDTIWGRSDAHDERLAWLEQAGHLTPWSLDGTPPIVAVPVQGPEANSARG